MAGTSRHSTGSQFGHALTAGLTTRDIQERTYPTPISRLLHYLHCVDLILDLSSIPFIKEYINYNSRSLSLLDEDSIVFWCGYFNPGNLIAANVIGVGYGLCGDNNFLTFDKEIIPKVWGIKFIELHEKTYNVKKYFVCSYAWISYFFIKPFDGEQYRIPRVLAMVVRTKQEEQNRNHARSAFCTIV